MNYKKIATLYTGYAAALTLSWGVMLYLLCQFCG